MSALAVRAARITRDRGRSAPDWDITLLEQSHAVAEVRLGGPDAVTTDGSADCRNHPVDPSRSAVEVFVGDEHLQPLDDPSSDTRGDHHACFTSVTCLSERRVRVTSCSAPPALLVGRAGAELVPSAPCSAAVAVVDEEHRLLVLSAAAYETLPRALVILLREFPSRFLRTDPVTLLETLFADIPVGSAALISPLLTSSPADRRTSKESS